MVGELILLASAVGIGRWLMNPKRVRTLHPWEMVGAQPEAESEAEAAPEPEPESELSPKARVAFLLPDDWHKSVQQFCTGCRLTIDGGPEGASAHSPWPHLKGCHCYIANGELITEKRCAWLWNALRNEGLSPVEPPQ